MSSRLIPPKVGSRIWQVRMISSAFCGVQLDVEDVDIGEALEEDRLAFHHRLSGQRADIAEPEHRGAVRHHADQIALGRVFVGEAGVALDLQARNGNARSVGEAEIPLGAARLGGRHRQLAGGRRGMVLQGIFRTNLHIIADLQR